MDGNVDVYGVIASLVIAVFLGYLSNAFVAWMATEASDNSKLKCRIIGGSMIVPYLTVFTVGVYAFVKEIYRYLTREYC